MFNFLKEKLGQAVGLFSKKVEEEAEVEEIEKEEQKEEKEEIRKEEKEEAREEKKARRIETEEANIRSRGRRNEQEPILDDGTNKLEEDSQDLIQDEDERVSDLERERLEKLEEKKRRIQQKLEEERRELEKRRLAEENRKREEAALEEQRKAAERKLEEAKKQEQPKKEILEKESPKPVSEKPAPKKEGFFARLFGRKKEEEQPDYTKKEELEKLPPKLKAKIVLDEEEFEQEEAFLDEEEEEFKKIDQEEKAFEAAKQRILDEEKRERQKLGEAREKGLFEKIKEKITKVTLSDEKFTDLFWELEVTMLENNVAVEVIDQIREDLRRELTSGRVSRKSISEIVHDSLKKSIEHLLSQGTGFDLVERIKSHKEKPFVIAFIGVNGSGKTTTMAKIANLLLKNNLSVVFAAADTFRAAAIQQLQEHADKLGVKMIRHDYESDPAAVAFDAISHAKAKGIDVVLIDTAGRLHTNDNLMNELKKLIRVNKPDLKIFVGESITGNDCVEQAKLFNEFVGIDSIILAKADVDEKGGAALSVSFVTKKPILYLGTGQGYNDLQKFDKEAIIKNIGL